MIFYRSLGWFEIALIILFGIFYFLYVRRVVKIGRALNTPYYTVVIKLALRTVVFGLLLFVFLGPAYGDSRKEVKSIGKDILICVDLSKSMDAFDVQPTRLEKVKFEMKKLVNAFNSDRIGIIIFSSEAFMQCPLTFDQNALNLFIDALNTGLVPSSGTDFGPPLHMALNKLTDQKNSETQEKSKVIVLISDGEDFGEEAAKAGQEIEDKNIKLFTLGVGTESGSQIYAGRAFKTDKNGNTIVTKLNPEGLKALASKTGGQYFEINESRNDVSRLINTINRMEGEMRDTRFVDVSANRYFYFLLAAFILLAIDTLFQVKTVRI